MVLPARKPTLPIRSDLPRRVPEMSGVEQHSNLLQRNQEKNRELIVGKGIELSGKIDACRHLIVEGCVNAEISDGEMLEIHEDGIFRGTVLIESAEINGYYEGMLRVRGLLLVKEKGQIYGDVECGVLEVKQGGEIVGKIAPFTLSKSQEDEEVTPV